MPDLMIAATPAQRKEMGFRWDGNKAVFPSWWPPSAEALEKYLETP
jgi:hypothetical protein